MTRSEIDSFRRIHFIQKFVDYEDESGVKIMKMLTHEHDDVDQEWEKWNIHVMKFLSASK